VWGSTWKGRARMTSCRKKIDLRAPSSDDCARAARETESAGAGGAPRVYLDNAATTRVLPEVAAAMAEALMGRFGNPSSLHGAGRDARKALEDARAAVARCLGAAPREVVFTSGGTESDNLALFGTARALREKGRHLVTSAIEHPAVLSAARALEAEGWALTVVGVDGEGRVSPDDVERALRPDTVLVSVMLVNNETGVVQPVSEIARRARARGVAVHTDAVQGLGKIPVDVGALGVDLLTISAHKIHGPKGVGALWARAGADLRPSQVGGHQEWNRRPGTENVAGIVGFAVAAGRACRDLPRRAAAVRALRERLERGLTERVGRVRVNGAGAERVPAIASVSVEGAEGESMLIGLDLEGVCVSTGSACSSGSATPSHVLAAMGLPRERAQGSLRLSLSGETTAAEIDAAVEALARVAARLRAIAP
jgi:cysteine desulfurase